jgi:hypothetical protein
MIRIREISDPELKRRIVAALAERRGMSPAAVPEWFELDGRGFRGPAERPERSRRAFSAGRARSARMIRTCRDGASWPTLSNW